MPVFYYSAHAVRLQKSFKTSNCRLPILKPMLHKLVKFCNQLSAAYNQALFQALLLICYHSYFRIGELLPSKHIDKKKVVQFKHISCSAGTVVISLHNYKTRRSQKTLLVTIKATGKKFCPVEKLCHFLHLRGDNQSPMFTHWDEKPVLKSQFNSIFKYLLDLGNFPSNVYKPHSLRLDHAQKRSYQVCLKELSWIADVGNLIQLFSVMCVYQTCLNSHLAQVKSP